MTTHSYVIKSCSIRLIIRIIFVEEYNVHWKNIPIFFLIESDRTTFYCIQVDGQWSLTLSTKELNKHGVRCLTIPAIVYEINTPLTLSSLGRTGACQISCMLTTLFYKARNQNWANIKKIQSNGLAGETHKHYLDFSM